MEWIYILEYICIFIVFVLSEETTEDPFGLTDDDGIPNTTEDQSGQGSDIDDQTWFIIGTVFIILFAIALMVIIVLMWRLGMCLGIGEDKDKKKKGYSKADAAEDAAETNE